MSQTVVIRCPACDRLLDVRADQLGRAGKCTHCGQVIALELRLMPQVAADEATQLLPTPTVAPAPAPPPRRMPTGVVVDESPILRRRSKRKGKKTLAPVKAMMLYWTVFGWPAMWLGNLLWSKI